MNLDISVSSPWVYKKTASSQSGTRLPSCGTTQLGFVEALSFTYAMIRVRWVTGRTPVDAYVSAARRFRVTLTREFNQLLNMALSLSATRWDPSADILFLLIGYLYAIVSEFIFRPVICQRNFRCGTATKSGPGTCGLGSHGHAASSVSSLTSASPVVTKERRTYS